MTNSYKELHLGATQQKRLLKSKLFQLIWILSLGCITTVTVSETAFAADIDSLPTIVFADLDDRGRDGLIDADAPVLMESEREQLQHVAADNISYLGKVVSNKIIQLRNEQGKLIKSDHKGAVLLQGKAAGQVSFSTLSDSRSMSVIEVGFKDQTRLSLMRQLPQQLDSDHYLAEDNTDFVVHVRAPIRQQLQEINLYSYDEDGVLLDQLTRLALNDTPCDRTNSLGLFCSQSQPLVLVGSFSEAQHPFLVGRSLVARVGGRIQASRQGMGEITIDVGTPASFPVDRYQVELNVSVLADSTGNYPAVGDNQSNAHQLLKAEIIAASQVWGACGIDIKLSDGAGFKIYPRPSGSSLVFGCNGLNTAQGGQVALKVDGESIVIDTHHGEKTFSIALRLALALQRAGFIVRRYSNPISPQEPSAVIDLLIRRPKGPWLEIESLYATPSNDPGLGICITTVELDDGLDHFTDATSASGTAEERCLIRQIQDDDPETIELLIIPQFSGTGRIGESFLSGLGNSIQNVIIIDRAGLRSNSRSVTIAHELGHLLLNMPGHPDDFGVDQPAQLMDADSSDASLFGPRRISLAQCQRAVQQSGPGAVYQLIRPKPLKKKKRTQ